MQFNNYPQHSIYTPTSTHTIEVFVLSIVDPPLGGPINASGIEWVGEDDRAGLRGYAQFYKNKHTQSVHAHLLVQIMNKYTYKRLLIRLFS